MYLKDYDNVSKDNLKSNFEKQIFCCFTPDFSLLLKNHFECSFVSSERSLQSSNVCFEVRSEYLR